MIKKLSMLVVIATFCSIFYSPLHRVTAEEVKDEMQLVLGEVRPMALDKAIKRIVITDPSIIEVSTVNDKELLLQGKAAGKTDLIIWDENNNQIKYPISIAGANWEDIKGRIDDLINELKLTGIETTINENENKIFITGELEDKDQKARLFLSMGKLKDYVLDLIDLRADKTLVQLDVKIYEVTRTEAETLGLNWPQSVTVSAADVVPAAGAVGIGSFGKLWQLGAGGGSWTKGFDTSTGKFAVTLNLLLSSGKAKVLSAPKLVCLSGKEASFNVGGEYPILTSTTGFSSGGGGGTSNAAYNIEYKPYGIKLTIQPTVKNTNEIFAKLKADVVDLDASTTQRVGTVDNPLVSAPGITNRNTETELYLRDGEMLLIAGLINKKDAETVRKVPFLWKIPVLGAFFKNTTKEKEGNLQRELIVSVVPRIIRMDKIEKEISGTKNDKTTSNILVKENAPSQEVASYAKLVQKKIYEGLFYPSSARQAGWSGTAVLSVDLDYTGKALDIQVKESSGYKVLDKTAVDIVSGQAPYPPFPPEIKAKDLWLDIPINFQAPQNKEAKVE